MRGLSTEVVVLTPACALIVLADDSVRQRAGHCLVFWARVRLVLLVVGPSFLVVLRAVLGAMAIVPIVVIVPVLISLKAVGGIMRLLLLACLV